MTNPTPEQWRELLAERKSRLRRFLERETPDIIIDAEMRLVQKAQRAVYGRKWNKIGIIYRIRARVTVRRLMREWMPSDD